MQMNSFGHEIFSQLFRIISFVSGFFADLPVLPVSILIPSTRGLTCFLSSVSAGVEHAERYIPSESEIR
ncbi:MAG: hypothetical protein ACTFAL_13625 [Candidatus Electronema sp. V4]|uniref:hypothetical protein n=1 Tax=Candidatus Electronema sp. V4 TaxID=3454756 RepID=UPI00405576FA